MPSERGFVIYAAPNRTETSFETPGSCMVTPYITGAMLIVFLLCVMMTNCVCTRHLFDQFGEAADVGFVERRVDFVEDAERARLILEDADQQGQRGQRLLAAGEQQHVLQLLARRRGDDVDAAFGAVFFVGEAHEGVSAAEQLAEGGLEVLVDACEGLFELLPRDCVDFLDRRCVFSMESSRSLRCVSRNSWRSAVSLYSSSAIMLTGPMASRRVRISR